MSDAAEILSDQSRVDAACRRLGETFDSVGIFCTRAGLDGITLHYESSSGNSYALLGQVDMWREMVSGLASDPQEEPGGEKEDRPW